MKSSILLVLWLVGSSASRILQLAPVRSRMKIALVLKRDPSAPVFVVNQTLDTMACKSLLKVYPYHTSLDEAECISVPPYDTDAESQNTDLCTYLLQNDYFVDPLTGHIKSYPQLSGPRYSDNALQTATKTCYGYDGIRSSPEQCSTTNEYFDQKKMTCAALPDVDSKHQYLAGVRAVVKTVCDTSREFEVHPGTFTTDRMCSPLSVCSGAVNGLFEHVKPTATSNRLCKYLEPCGPGFYFRSSKGCVACSPGTYMDREQHYANRCVAHDASACASKNQVLVQSLSDLPTSSSTEKHCKSFVHGPFGSQATRFDGSSVDSSSQSFSFSNQRGAPLSSTPKSSSNVKANAKTSSILKSVSSLSSKCPAPTPEAQYYQHFFGAYDDEYICEKCTRCDDYKKTCTEFEDAVCREPPQVEALYIFSLAAYTSYIVVALAMYFRIK